MPAMRLELLKTILSQPSAPFREGHVISVITRELEQAKVPHFADSMGNVIIGVRSASEYKKMVRKSSTEPLRVFIAHMDHPGFHGAAWESPTRLKIRWLGGSPTQYLENAKVWLASKEGWQGEGRMTQAQLIPSGRAIESAVILLSDQTLFEKFQQPQQLYGGFAFRQPQWQEGELLYTKAADDLVGTFAILSLALDFWSKAPKKGNVDPPFLGLLTRAEEVGFIGAIGHFDLGWLEKSRRPVICVSLETSRTLPGAEIGKGPVVRLGDKFTVFDAGALRVFSELAKNALPEKHQKRVMDGGTCEATAATAFGFPSVGISVPLGNYHNQDLEGGPDASGPNGPAPEFVHLQDVSGLISLCQALLKPRLPWKTPWNDKVKELKKELKKYRPLLRTGP